MFEDVSASTVVDDVGKLRPASGVRYDVCHGPDPAGPWPDDHIFTLTVAP